MHIPNFAPSDEHEIPPLAAQEPDPEPELYPLGTAPVGAAAPALEETLIWAYEEATGAEDAGTEEAAAAEETAVDMVIWLGP